MIYYCDNQRHLVCYPFSIDNLHKMADDLNIKRCWFHSGKKKNSKDTLAHYDIPKRRIDEVKSKCIIVSNKDIVNIILYNQIPTE